MAAGKLSLEAVRDFLLASNGMVTNLELVTHFRPLLDDPENRATNKEKFKEYVNTLSIVKTNEKKEKCLVLKKKYRVDSLSSGGSTSSLETAQLAARAQSEPPLSQLPTTKTKIEDQQLSHTPAFHSDDSLSDQKSPRFCKDNLSMDTISTSSVASSTSEEELNVFSVKERAKHLNKIESESELQRVPFRKSERSKLDRQREGSLNEEDGQSSVGYTILNPEQREWMLICCTADYHPMSRILAQNKSLAKEKNFTNTALHWAAKHGESNVIKLVAGTYGVNVNQKSGFTPLHLAAMNGHEECIELLVQTYKADPNLRDHCGKKAKQYLRSSASTKAQQLLLSSRLSSASTIDENFLRNASFKRSNRARAISSLIQASSNMMKQPILRSSWAGPDDVWIERSSPRSSPSPCSSIESSPQMRRKFLQPESDLMPPPASLPLRKKGLSARLHSRKESLDSDSNDSDSNVITLAAPQKPTSSNV